MEKVPEKVKKLVNEAGVDIPDLNFDREHRIGSKKEKKTDNDCKIHKIKTFCLEPEES